MTEKDKQRCDAFIKKYFKSQTYGPKGYYIVADQYTSYALPDIYNTLTIVYTVEHKIIFEMIKEGLIQYQNGKIIRPDNFYQPGYWTCSDYIIKPHYLLPLVLFDKLFFIWVSHETLEEYGPSFLSEEDQLKLLLEEL